MSLDVYLRDEADLSRKGQLDMFQSFQATLRFSGISTWTVTLNNVAAIEAETQVAGRGILVTRDGEVLLSGPAVSARRFQHDDSNGRVLGGVSDTVWLERRLAYPEAPAVTTVSSEQDVRSGPAGVVMADYVDYNAGPAAHADRQVNGLASPARLAIGNDVTGRGRFQTVMALLQSLAAQGGDLGFHIIQDRDTDELNFEVYDPADRAAEAVFSVELGTLAGFEYDTIAPGANVAVVGGSGEGTARVFATHIDAGRAAVYGRVETFRDRRDTADAAELDQAGEEATTEQAAATAVRLTPQETAGMRFGRDYRLGDTVSVVVDGVVLPAVVREINVLVNENGETITPTIATTGAGLLIREAEQLERRHQRRRLTDLERR